MKTLARNAAPVCSRLRGPLPFGCTVNCCMRCKRLKVMKLYLTHSLLALP